MKPFFKVMMMLCVSFSVAACSANPKPPLQVTATEPCDVLVDIPTTQETNEYLRNRDRPAFIGLARNQKRIQDFECRERANAPL